VSTDRQTIDPNCTICKGEGWVCENHDGTPWGGGDGCCGGAGMPCACNPDGDPEPGTVLIWDAQRGFIQ